MTPENLISGNEIIAVIGGTGKEGKGLAYRWARAGFPVIIGSRSVEKAHAVVDEIKQLMPEKPLRLSGKLNQIAAQECAICVLAIPFSAHLDFLNLVKPYVQGKLLIDVTVPLVPPKVSMVQMPPSGSIALETFGILGEDVEIATAFQNISYEKMFAEEPVDCDVLVCGSSKLARQKSLELVKAAGMDGIDAGPLENSVVVEGLTSVLIGINRQFGVKAAGIRITGIPRN